MKIKKFSNTYSDDLEEDINLFLEENSNINILHKTQPIIRGDYIIIFIYYDFDKTSK